MAHSFHIRTTHISIFEQQIDYKKTQEQKRNSPSASGATTIRGLLLLVLPGTGSPGSKASPVFGSTPGANTSSLGAATERSPPHFSLTAFFSASTCFGIGSIYCLSLASGIDETNQYTFTIEWVYIVRSTAFIFKREITCVVA